MSTRQSRLHSLVESIVNIAIGFGISLAAQALFLPMLGVQVSLSQNFVFALIMTAISICRSYLLRRMFEALHIRRPLSPAMNAVIAERFRQIEQEGWSHAHDDSHAPGELSAAGGCYAISGTGGERPMLGGVPNQWPWSASWWKPQDFRRDRIRAAALIIAEIERHDRTKVKR